MIPTNATPHQNLVGKNKLRQGNRSSPDLAKNTNLQPAWPETRRLLFHNQAPTAAPQRYQGDISGLQVPVPVFALRNRHNQGT